MIEAQISILVKSKGSATQNKAGALCEISNKPGKFIIDSPEKDNDEMLKKYTINCLAVLAKANYPDNQQEFEAALLKYKEWLYKNKNL